MLEKRTYRNNWFLSVFIVFLMVLTGFVAMAGAAEEDNVNENNGLSAIIGKVFNADGEPLEGVLVVLSYGLEQSDPEKIEKFEQKTNERGLFEFNELKRGVYELKTRAEGYAPWSEIVKVPAGETVELKIMLKKVEQEQKMSVVIGKVFNALEEVPIPGALIGFLNENSDRRPIKTETDREGHFKVEVPRGEYTLVVEADGFHPYKEPIKIPGVEEVKLRIGLKPRQEDPEPKERPVLCGHIFDAKTDKPIFGWVELSYGNPEPAPDPCRIKKLKDCDCGENEEKPEDFFLKRTYSNCEGFYEFSKIPPGHYEIRVFAKGHAMYYNEINIKDDPLYIDVYLLREVCPPMPSKPAMSVIGGQVLDGKTKKPIEGALVCVAPLELVKKVMEMMKAKDIDPKQLNLEEFGLEPSDIENINLDEVEVDDFEINYLDLAEYEVPQDLENLDNLDKPVEPELKTRGDEIDEAGNSAEPIEELPEQPPKPAEERPIPPEPVGREILRKFCTKTNERGLFKLRVPPGEYVLIIKARGYLTFTHKVIIRPSQKILVRVPLRPGNDRPLVDAKTNDSESGAKSDGTLEILGITTTTAGATNSILNSVLGILFIIAMILGVLVWRKYNTIRKSSKPKRIKH